MHSIRLPSYAKINLGLAIKGQRADGFHDIETILLQVSLRDEITLESLPGTEIRFVCAQSKVPESDNTCLRAARLFLDHVGAGRGLKITLKKVIPMGAGLGGGSSNGAVVLLGLNRLWEFGLGEAALLDLAAQLGSDVPFFIRGGTALAQGRGEVLSPISASFPFRLLIVDPGIEISTKWAYRQANLDLTMNKKSCTLASFKDINFNNVDFNNSFHNQFEEIVFPNYPLVQKVKEAIHQCQPKFASMSGSGASVYGIFETSHQAREAKRQLEGKYASFVARPVSWGHASVWNGSKLT